MTISERIKVLEEEVNQLRAKLRGPRTFVCVQDPSDNLSIKRTVSDRHKFFVSVMEDGEEKDMFLSAADAAVLAEYITENLKE
jgi:hypothetical protein